MNLVSKILEARTDAQKQIQVSELMSCVGKLISPCKGLSIEDLLNPAGEIGLIHVIYDDVLVATVSFDEAPEEEEKKVM